MFKIEVNAHYLIFWTHIYNFSYCMSHLYKLHFQCYSNFLHFGLKFNFYFYLFLIAALWNCWKCNVIQQIKKLWPYTRIKFTTLLWTNIGGSRISQRGAPALNEVYQYPMKKCILKSLVYSLDSPMKRLSPLQCYLISLRILSEWFRPYQLSGTFWLNC